MLITYPLKGTYSQVSGTELTLILTVSSTFTTANRPLWAAVVELWFFKGHHSQCWGAAPSTRRPRSFCGRMSFDCCVYFLPWFMEKRRKKTWILRIGNGGECCWPKFIFSLFKKIFIWNHIGSTPFTILHGRYCRTKWRVSKQVYVFTQHNCVFFLLSRVLGTS